VGKYLVKVEFVAIDIKSYVTWQVRGNRTAPQKKYTTSNSNTKVIMGVSTDGE